MEDRELLSAGLASWLQEVVATDKPLQSMAAFRFGLTEMEEGYALYLTGSVLYTEDDDEWAALTPAFIAKQERITYFRPRRIGVVLAVVRNYLLPGATAPHYADAAVLFGQYPYLHRVR